jgi:hypothetical protein
MLTLILGEVAQSMKDGEQNIFTASWVGKLGLVVLGLLWLMG